MLFQKIVKYLFLVPTVLLFSFLFLLRFMVDGLLALFSGPEGMVAFIWGPILALIMTIGITIGYILFERKLRIPLYTQIFLGVCLLVASMLLYRSK